MLTTQEYDEFYEDSFDYDPEEAFLKGTRTYLDELDNSDWEDPEVAYIKYLEQEAKEEFMAQHESTLYINIKGKENDKK